MKDTARAAEIEQERKEDIELKKQQRIAFEKVLAAHRNTMFVGGDDRGEFVVCNEGELI